MLKFNKECNICNDNTLFYYKKCIFCTVKICNICYYKLVDDTICPYCRNENWIKIKSNKIKPIDDKFYSIDIEKDFKNNNEYNKIEENCCDILVFFCMCLPRLIGFTFIFWMFGVFTIVFTVSYYNFINSNIILIIILPIIIGFFEFFFVWLCCCSRHISFTQIILNL